jgi:hypothetical protein
LAFARATNASRVPSGEMASGAPLFAGMKTGAPRCTLSLSACGGGAGLRPWTENVSATASSAASAHGTAPRQKGTLALADAPSSSSGAPRSASSSATRTSAISCWRFFGFRSRHRRSKRLTDGGVAAGSSFHRGSRVRTAASTSETVSPSKSRRPVSISKSSTPKAQTSARLSTGLPRACSGDM